MSNREVVVLSVGGVRFVTRASTLQQFPESRLARMLNHDDQEFKLVNGEFFVDRDGTLFSYIMDFLRTLQVSLPTDFSDYQRLQREAEFYGLYLLADVLSQEHLLRPRLEILEVRFSLQEMQAFFRIFGSCSTTVETLADQITVFTGQQSGQSWNSPFSSQKPLVPLPLERPSHHDMFFQCGTDCSAGDQFVARYVSIKPDDRKLINGTNVLGLLLDTLFKNGFHLISTRTVSSEDKVECYSLERMKRPACLTLTVNQTPGSSRVAQAKKSQVQKGK
ncbi:potassium channel regulatory protein [Patagioenas fasciata monilis]|uniref:Potassium channel regulatory protein n=1 Tax=Patagioenas fasciata monilis TaxID=372326 RepID=A0A1V4J509_PATFA|nr:potassium channel regulatory protein [Patagioenas fasciata monilis]